MKYSAILDLEVRHSFYGDGKCPDFAIEASAGTRRLLANHRCVLKPRHDGVRVVTAFDGAGEPFLPLAEDAALVFHLRLLNDDFSLFTDLAAVDQQPAPLFTGGGAGGELQLGSRDARSARGTFAEVEIRPGAAGVGEEQVLRKFHIAFEARRWRWTYYCVTDLPAASGQLGIVDAVNGAEEPLVFGASNGRKLDLEPDPTDRIAQQLAERYPHLRRIRFVSDSPVACRQAPRRHLELHLDGARLSGPLSNPSPQSYSRFGEPAALDSLFRVIRYSNQPVPNPGE